MLKRGGESFTWERSGVCLKIQVFLVCLLSHANSEMGKRRWSDSFGKGGEGWEQRAGGQEGKGTPRNQYADMKRWRTVNVWYSLLSLVGWKCLLFDLVCFFRYALTERNWMDCITIQVLLRRDLLVPAEPSWVWLEKEGWLGNEWMNEWMNDQPRLEIDAAQTHSWYLKGLLLEI